MTIGSFCRGLLRRGAAPAPFCPPESPSALLLPDDPPSRVRHVIFLCDHSSMMIVAYSDE